MTSFSMEWPRYPTLTPAGKVSKAKLAGKPLPWLSANVVGNLGRRQHRVLVRLWREAAHDGAGIWAFKWPHGLPKIPHPCYLDIVLYRQRARMDSYAILEGMKPIIDGMVNAGLFPDDTQEFIRGGIARSVQSRTPGLHVVFRAVTGLDGAGERWGQEAPPLAQP